MFLIALGICLVAWTKRILEHIAVRCAKDPSDLCFGMIGTVSTAIVIFLVVGDWIL